MLTAVNQQMLKKLGEETLHGVERFVMTEVLEKGEIGGWRIQKDAGLSEHLLGVCEEDVPAREVAFHRLVHDVSRPVELVSHLGGTLDDPQSVSINPSQLLPTLAAFPHNANMGVQMAGFTFVNGVLLAVVSEIYISGIGFLVYPADTAANWLGRSGMLIFGPATA